MYGYVGSQGPRVNLEENLSGQIIATGYRRVVTPNGGGLVRDSFQNPRKIQV